MRAARCGTLLCISLLCSSGMLLYWLLPSGLHCFFIAKCPSPAAAGSFTARGGCSSLAVAGFFIAGGFIVGRGMLLPSSLDHDLLLPFPEILGLGVASLRHGRTMVASAVDDFRRGRMAIASTIDDFRHGRVTASSPLGTGWPVGRETMAAALRLVLGSLLFYDPTANRASKGRRLLL
ncbi:hypothetical protein B296_00012727 [Ensete ventricosum]|uniref:Uncharacterized protein n=1 Tax=Ensete ventricosum TaxID=4639 RepID=A0A426ZKU2_ENSVE|nr:hypothetical protein B296_00012727 [Ensete ventricosum]